MGAFRRVTPSPLRLIIADWAGPVSPGRLTKEGNRSLERNRVLGRPGAETSPKDEEGVVVQCVVCGCWPVPQ